MVMNNLEKMCYKEKDAVLPTVDEIKDNGALYSIGDLVCFRYHKYFRRMPVHKEGLISPPNVDLNPNFGVPRKYNHFVIFGFIQIDAARIKKIKKRIIETFCVLGYSRNMPLLDHYYANIVTTKDTKILVYPPDALEKINK